MNPLRYFQKLRWLSPSGEAFGADVRNFAHPALAADIRAMETFLSGLFEVVWIKDLQGKFAFVNDALVERTDIPRDAIIGHTSSEIARDWPRSVMGYD